ncbi:MAG: hydantoinase B/oxoprolinase family protein [Candidatus Hydrogenedentes bacterium]|nr:hydantoinase B/oxoprolinase family protein [Candidatus Hydrogenedentota bacterium]
MKTDTTQSQNSWQLDSVCARFGMESMANARDTKDRMRHIDGTFGRHSRSERRVYAPYGVNGAEPGQRGRNLLQRAHETGELPGHCAINIQPGDILSIETPGTGFANAE